MNEEPERSTKQLKILQGHFEVLKEHLELIIGQMRTVILYVEDLGELKNEGS